MELPSPNASFRSNRSYPSLNHVSLAPLTPRFPIDDDPEPQDYISAHDDNPDGTPPSQSGSYLASRSVPGTPGLLSNSRSASRTRHPRSKSSSRAHVNAVDVQTEDNTTSQQPSAKRRSSRHHLADSPARPDSEWMLRTGIALASSTREEKGQSWLEKRESSTSLVSLDYDATPHHPPHHRRSWSGKKPLSGSSTPATLSRRGSLSRAMSRRNSKAGLAMTSLDMTHSSRPLRSGVVSPAVSEERDFVPDIVDERIRSEIASIQRELDEDMSVLEASSVDSDDEIDEQEMQRLTRERGFGMGGWIDRLVEWTLFGVDDLPSGGQPGPAVIANCAQTPSRHDDQTPAEGGPVSEPESDDDFPVDLVGDYDPTMVRDYDVPASVEGPGERGGWEDAWWLFRVMKHALL